MVVVVAAAAVLGGPSDGAGGVMVAVSLTKLWLWLLYWHGRSIFKNTLRLS